MRLLLPLLLLFPPFLGAQSVNGLVANYLFEGNLGDASGSSDNLGVPEGAVDFDCGVSGEALLLTGPDDFVRIPGGATTNVNRLFSDLDFTVSFYFKPTGDDGLQFLLSKRATDCANENYFTVSYASGSRTLSATLRQGDRSINISEVIRNASCWQHVTVRRRDRELRLFLNGRSVESGTAPGRIDASNTGDLLIGSSECRTAAEGNFRGLIDNLQFYGRALEEEEVATLYTGPDRILTPDARIFLGESVEIDLNSNCGTEFRWAPSAGVESPTEAEPTITPTEEGLLVYRVDISGDQSSCIASDSIEIRVIDPATLECDAVYLPKAFTPNGTGPEVNETFGISNPFAVQQLLSLQIFDRYGGEVFATSDAFARWDGTFKNKPVNPGVMLWRLAYLCEGQEIIRTGSVTILR